MKTWSNVRFDVPVLLAQSVRMSNFGRTYTRKDRGVRTDADVFFGSGGARAVSVRVYISTFAHNRGAPSHVELTFT